MPEVTATFKPETPRQRFLLRHSALKTERSSFDPLYKSLAANFLPRRGRWSLQEVNKGERSASQIINGTPRFAARTLQSGMMSGLTSPARPWFELSTPDASLKKFGPVKEWLHQVTTKMREVFAKSNLYMALPVLYGELGVFGTLAVIEEEDFEDIVRFYPLTVGQYCIAQNARLSVDTLYRDLRMTVRQMVQQFGIGAVSDNVANMFRNGQLEQWVEVVHLIEPNDEREYGRVDSKNLKFRSVYFEVNGTQDKILRTSGFYELPHMAARWELTGEDTLGSSPGMDALGDARQLQLEERRKAQLVDKLVDPPMRAPAELQHKKTSLLPGDVTYYSGSTQHAPGFEPAYQVHPQGVTAVKDVIVEIENRVNTAFYADLFLMLSMSDRREITAREVAERHEEKLIMLGPVLERLNDELLDPIIDRTFAIMLRKGLVPEPPQELQGKPLKVEYTSILAQAQKMVGLSGVERLLTTAAGIAAAAPDRNVFDKINTDEVVEEVASMLGTPPRLINSEERVAEIREGRAQAQQQQQAMQTAQLAAQTTKDLAAAPVGQGSALDRVLNQVGGQ